jgi:4,5-DOPA dioxygenase extradiol
MTTAAGRLPTLFLSHGSPMHAIQPGEAGRAWAALGRALPKPRAILIASAHWETAVPMLTGNPKPQTIHDFGGFPAALYEIQYPAPGAPQVAERAVGLLKAAGITAGIDGCRGLDHGAWVPLRHMYPDADVPVAQIAVQPERGTAHHVELGRALAPLADEGVLIIGSGHATHNLRDWMSNSRRPEPLAYVRAFSAWLAATLAAHDTDALVAYRERAPEAARAHPSEEHFLPLFVAYGAAGEHSRPERVVDGFENGALAMDSYLFRADEAMAHA